MRCLRQMETTKVPKLFWDFSSMAPGMSLSKSLKEELAWVDLPLRKKLIHCFWPPLSMLEFVISTFHNSQKTLLSGFHVTFGAFFGRFVFQVVPGFAVQGVDCGCRGSEIRERWRWWSEMWCNYLGCIKLGSKNIGINYDQFINYQASSGEGFLPSAW